MLVFYIDVFFIVLVFKIKKQSHFLQWLCENKRGCFYKSVTWVFVSLLITFYFTFWFCPLCELKVKIMFYDLFFCYFTFLLFYYFNFILSYYSFVLLRYCFIINDFNDTFFAILLFYYFLILILYLFYIVLLSLLNILNVRIK